MTPLHLQAGRLSMRLDRGTGMLRDICWDGREVLRGVYAAIRDQNWDTVWPQFDVIDVQSAPGGCLVDLAARCQSATVRYRWTGRVQLSDTGKIVYRFDGRAEAAFLRNRIGFCVLHSNTCAGQAMSVQHIDGSWRDHRFPLYIAAHQPVKDIHRIMHRPTADLQVDVRLEGDAFEMEDQRNWTDASFKTYCTPLARTFPVSLAEGDRVQQTVTVQIEDTRVWRSTLAVQSADGATLVVVRGGSDDAAPRSLPSIGLGLPRRIDPLSSGEVSMLRDLRIEHLRVDLDLAEPQLRQRWQAAVDLAQGIECGLEVAVRMDADELHRFASLSNSTLQDRMRVVRCFVFDAAGYPASPQVVAAAAPWVARLFPAAELGGGTDHYFAELNRRRPDSPLLQVVGYSINPQVHASDDQSLMETLAVQGETVRSASAFLTRAAVAVTPITLRPRHNPNATAAAEASVRPPPAEPAADPRQRTDFAAAWAVGSIAALTATEVRTLTYFETVGRRGVMGSGGVAYPVYGVLQDVLGYRGGGVLPATASDGRVAALRLRRGAEERWLVANLTDQPLTVCLETAVALRRFRQGRGRSTELPNGPFVLPPYGVLTADTAG